MREYISIATHVAYWITIIVLLVVAIGNGLSQPPAPPGYGVHQEKLSQARNSENQEDKIRETLWQRTISDPTAFFTFVLAIFTGVLAVSTFFLWLVTSTAAKAALRSAVVAERALTDLERPFILPSIHPNIFEGSRTERNKIFLRFGIGNYGRTPAIITHSHIGCILRSKEEGFSPPTIPDSNWVPQLVLAPGEKNIREYDSLPILLSYHQINVDTDYPETIALRASCSIDCEMYFFFAFRYNDIFGKTHETVRCWRYQVLAFRPMQGEEYNRTT